MNDINHDNEANRKFIRDLHDLVYDSLEDDADFMSVIGTLLVASADLVFKGGGDADDFVGIARTVAEAGQEQQMLEDIGALDEVFDALDEGDEDRARELLEEAIDNVEGTEASSGDERDMMFQ